MGWILMLKQRLRQAINQWICDRGYVSFNSKKYYAEDGLFSLHSDEFRRDPKFIEAYQRGVEAGHGVDPGIGWRVHVALWAARVACRVPGDFVECGVNAGMISSAIMHHLDWARVPKKYFLVDTFAGPVLDQFSPEEHQSGWVALVEQRVASGGYVTDMDRVRETFAEWPNAIPVQGVVPEILSSVPASEIAFLHLDLNCAAPELAAIEYCWSRIPTGGVVLMDDYAHHGNAAQKHAIDEWSRRAGVPVLALPTGQGLIIR